MENNINFVSGKPLKLVKARTCNGCAVLLFCKKNNHVCKLGYKLDSQFKPLQPCPKPKSVQALIDLLHQLRFSVK